MGTLYLPSWLFCLFFYLNFYLSLASSSLSRSSSSILPALRSISCRDILALLYLLICLATKFWPPTILPNYFLALNFSLRVWSSFSRSKSYVKAEYKWTYFSQGCSWARLGQTNLANPFWWWFPVQLNRSGLCLGVTHAIIGKWIYIFVWPSDSRRGCCLR